MNRRILILAVCCIFMFPIIGLESAQAGVLLRSGQVRSRVRSRVPRMRLGHNTASTWVSNSRRANPIRNVSLSSQSAISSYSRRVERYNREMKRYERRKQREAANQAKRRERENARKNQLRKREQAKKLAKLNRKRDLERQLGSDSGGSKSVNGDSSVVRIDGQKKSQNSFWSRFWQKLIGKK